MGFPETATATNKTCVQSSSLKTVGREWASTLCKGTWSITLLISSAFMRKLAWDVKNRPICNKNKSSRGTLVLLFKMDCQLNYGSKVPRWTQSFSIIVDTYGICYYRLQNEKTAEDDFEYTWIEVVWTKLKVCVLNDKACAPLGEG